jgi:hypothetical protein
MPARKQQRSAAAARDTRTPGPQLQQLRAVVKSTRRCNCNGTRTRLSLQTPAGRASALFERRPCWNRRPPLEMPSTPDLGRDSMSSSSAPYFGSPERRRRRVPAATRTRCSRFSPPLGVLWRRLPASDEASRPSPTLWPLHSRLGCVGSHASVPGSLSHKALRAGSST